MISFSSSISMSRLLLLLPLLVPGSTALGARKHKPPEPTPLERYIREANSRPAPDAAPATGSTWTPASRLADLGSDLRASQVDDVITIVVAEQASAVSSGTTKTSRKSSTSNSITALAGVTRATGPWANLAGVNADTQLDGQGATTRTTTLSTILAARVAQVLPNGFLVIEGT
ncbi:MAG TPA: flagellar basal body L-ring protein FlgH, partial [Bryobacteraceae bacterium]|nr:flagellar basal body L-ring protein FlgH [Bryobacteraceae bacterium]